MNETSRSPTTRDAGPGRRSEPAPLTAGQQVALARVGCAVEHPGSLVVLCGPAGVGTTTVLRHLEATLAPPGSAGWTVTWRGCADGHGSDRAPCTDVIIADHAHAAADGGIARFVAQCRAASPETRIVLAGRGRLLTLLGRDRGVEAQVRLRAILHAFTPSETGALLAVACERAGSARDALDGVAGTIHQIAGGIPAAILRLAEMALLVQASRPQSPLVADDIEALHRRLSLDAA